MAATEHSPAGPARVYAVARVGTQHIAIANGAVSQAVACPERLVTLPRRTGALEGLFSWRGQWVPVVRLDHWVAVGPAPQQAPRAESRRILVLCQGGLFIGLLVDALMGVRAVRPHEVARVYRDDNPEELFESVVDADGEQPALAVLETGRLMALAEAWCEAAEVKPSAAVAAGGLPSGPHLADTSRQMPYASFTIGDLLVGLPASDIGELIPLPPMQSAMPAGSAARGICTWRGRFVPVVDLSGALAATPRAEAAASVCIVRWGGLAIGVLVHEVGGLRAVDASRVERRAGPDPLCDVLLGVTLLGEDRTLHLLDSAKLIAAFPEAALSAPRGEPAHEQHSAGPHSAEAFIVFDAGALRASPASQVQEVVSLPAAVLKRLDAEQPATLEWRGFVVPVVDLRRQLPAARQMRASHLVVIADGAHRVAVTIGGVKELIAARTASRTRVSAGPSVQFDMVTVDDGARKLSYALLDLASFTQPPAGKPVLAAA